MRYLLTVVSSLGLLVWASACNAASAVPVQPTAAAVPPQVAPTIQAAPTDVMATANAVRTEIAPTLNAVATQVAPSISAAETQAVPTLSAIATEVVPTVNAAATTTAESGLRITGEQLASSDPAITVQNDGDQLVDLSDWTLQVGETQVKLPPNTQLGPGTALVVHATSGTPDAGNVYLGGSLQTALNALKPGARITLLNPSGASIASFTVPG